MVEAIMLWNEPNNLSHWDFKIDPEWKQFAALVHAGSKAIREANPEIKIVLGGISPIDPRFIELLAGYGVLDSVDIIAVHGFPLDWNHWQISDWPKKLDEIRAVVGGKSIWVSEAGASSFGAEEVQLFGLQKTAELLLPLVERVHWYSLFDLPATWTATTRHKEAEGSSYYRHYYMGLFREDGSPKLAAARFSGGAWRLSVVPFRGSPAEAWGGAFARTRSTGGAHGHQLGGLVPSGLGGMVRPPDGGAG